MRTMAERALERPNMVPQSIPYDVRPPCETTSRVVGCKNAPFHCDATWQSDWAPVWPTPQMNGPQIYFGMQDLRQMIKNVQSFVVRPCSTSIDRPPEKWQKRTRVICVFSAACSVPIWTTSSERPNEPFAITAAGGHFDARAETPRQYIRRWMMASHDIA